MRRSQSQSVSNSLCLAGLRSCAALAHAHWASGEVPSAFRHGSRLMLVGSSGRLLSILSVQYHLSRDNSLAICLTLPSDAVTWPAAAAVPEHPSASQTPRHLLPQRPRARGTASPLGRPGGIVEVTRETSACARNTPQTYVALRRCLCVCVCIYIYIYIQIDR